MNKTFYISLAVLIFIIAACGRKKSKEIIYDDAELTEVKAVPLALKPMDTKDYFVNPQSIDFIRDSLLLIMDRNNGDYVCHIINKKGEVKKAFGRRGKAKNELVQPANCSVSADGDSVYIYDSMLMKLLGYSLDDVMDGDVNPHSVCDMGKMLTSAGINNTRIWTVHNIGKNRFLT